MNKLRRINKSVNNSVPAQCYKLHLLKKSVRPDLRVASRAGPVKKSATRALRPRQRPAARQGSAGRAIGEETEEEAVPVGPQ